MAIARTSCCQVHHVLDSRNRLFIKAFDIDALLNVFTNMQVVRLWIKQIHDLLVINFEVTSLN